MEKSKELLLLMLLLTLSLVWVAPAQADTVTATITADNHYGFYIGDLSGATLNFIGRNEPGPEGIPGDNNWSLPETYQNVPVQKGGYLYVLAWNDGGSPQMWIGQFSKPGGGALYSNTSDWLFTVSSGPNPMNLANDQYPEGPLPALSAVKADIAYANANNGWGTPQASAPNDENSTWGAIPGISPSASFIWHDTLDAGSSSDPNYVIFRSKDPVSPAPLPPTVMLVASGLVGLVLLAKKNKPKGIELY